MWNTLKIYKLAEVNSDAGNELIVTHIERMMEIFQNISHNEQNHVGPNAGQTGMNETAANVIGVQQL